MYTVSRQKKNDAQSASVSRRNCGTSSAPTVGRATAASFLSENSASAGMSCPMRCRSARSSGHRSRWRSMYRGDSGSTLNSTSARRIGKAPADTDV